MDSCDNQDTKQILKGKTCLIVEDHFPMRQFIELILKHQLGCDSIFQAEDAEEALGILENPAGDAVVDLIVCDWGLPGMDGDMFLHEIRLMEAYKQTPFLMATGNNSRDLVITAIQAGVTDFLIKPFTAANLVRKIKRSIVMARGRTRKRYLVKEKYPVKLVSSSAKCTGELVDISDAGCGILLNCGLSIPMDDEQVNLTIIIEDESIQMNAKSRGIADNAYVKESSGVIKMGFEFLPDESGLPDLFKQLLDRYQSIQSANITKESSKVKETGSRKRLLDID